MTKPGDNKAPLTYADAGVDIEAGNQFVKAIGPLAKSTQRPGANVSLGGFAGLFDPKAAGYEDPLLVAATDGVGTKLKLAIDTDTHTSVGIDLVAMCVNDLIVQRAEPLFFLDYFATGQLAPNVAEAVVAGIAEGCKQAHCALIGGETAEMPGMYREGDYDLAGFAVGALERAAVEHAPTIESGDVVLGLASSGVHSNGFSLVRKVLEREGLALEDPAPFAPGQSVGDALLTPTQIYVGALMPGIKDGTVKAMAHITGGGLLENIPRVMPMGLTAKIDTRGWYLPPVFAWLRDKAALPPEELTKTFNCGIGMAVIVSAEKAEACLSQIQQSDIMCYMLGHIEAGEDAVVISGPSGHWGYNDAWQVAG